MKEDLFSKFKDYNKELEKIIEKKGFSKDAKNLLLSMFYKLEISYNDYYIVKKKSKSKQEYLENILENISQCNDIKLIKSKDEEFEEYIDNNLYKTNLKSKTIKSIENELALLSAILELNNFKIYLNQEYNLIRNSMPYLLNMAYDMENIEVLRDFNAWSWNILVKEIKDININLIYQNLKIALNLNIFDKIQKNTSNIDIIEIIENDLLQSYDKKIVDKFMQLIFKISILIYINVSDNERKRLYEEKENLEIELNETKDKQVYIEKITQEKKKLTDQLKQIDLIMKDRELLLKEYEKRNNSLSEYNRIFSISHLVEKLQRERKRTLDKINLCNNNMQPKIYIKNKNKLQNDYNLLKNVKFDCDNNIDKYIKEVQKIFIKDILNKKVENSNTRSEITDCLYEIRYYNFLPYTRDTLIRDIAEFKEILLKIEEKLIKKLYDNKLINTLSSNKKNDITIIRNIFETKIINIEDIYFEIKKKQEKYHISIYDEKETLEKEFEIDLEYNKKDKIKLNKKIKLFI